MSNISKDIEHLTHLVTGLTAQIKDVQAENTYIRGQVEQVRDLQIRVGDNSSLSQEPSNANLSSSQTYNLQFSGQSSQTPPLNATPTSEYTPNGASDQHLAAGKTSQAGSTQPNSAPPSASGGLPPTTSPVQQQPGYAVPAGAPYQQPVYASQFAPYPAYYPSPYHTPGVAPGYHLSANPAYAPVSRFRDSAPRSNDLQAAYKAIQDRWKHVSLEPDYIFNDSTKGLKKEEIPVHQVVAISAHILETGLKIFSQYSDESGLPPDAANELFLTMCHHMRVLQDKQCALVVKTTYDTDFSRMYQSVLSGNVNMRQENIEAINTTQSILQYRQPTNTRSQQQFKPGNHGNSGKSQGKKSFKHSGKNFKNRSAESRTDDTANTDE